MNNKDTKNKSKLKKAVEAVLMTSAVIEGGQVIQDEAKNIFKGIADNIPVSKDSETDETEKPAIEEGATSKAEAPASPVSQPEETTAATTSSEPLIAEARLPLASVEGPMVLSTEELVETDAVEGEEVTDEDLAWEDGEDELEEDEELLIESEEDLAEAGEAITDEAVEAADASDVVESLDDSETDLAYVEAVEEDTDSEAVAEIDESEDYCLESPEENVDFCEEISEDTSFMDDSINLV